MADASINLQASNLFSLNAAFKTQSSGTNEVTTNVTVIDETGNVSCERNLEDITNYSQSAGYCGSDFVGNFGTFLTTFGEIQNSKAVTGITINMTAGEYCTVDIEGHNHGAKEHASVFDNANMSVYFVAGAGFTTWDGFGVPDFGVTLGAASPSSATVTLSLNHIDQIDEAGAHLVGTNTTPRFELSMDFSGVPTSNTIALLETDFAAITVGTDDWDDVLVDTIDSGDSNSDFDTFAFTAHGHVDIA